MPRRPDELTGRADILLAEAVDGEVRVNVGDAGTGEGFGAKVAMWGVPGFVGVPDAPDENGAAELLYIVDGPRKYGVAARDNRTASKAGNPVYGDRLIYSSCDARFLLKKADNGVTLYTVNETDNGSSMAVNLSGKKGEIVLTNGGSMVRMKKDEITLAAGGTVVHIGPDGLAVYGKHCGLNTGSGNLGTLGPLVPPQGLGSLLAGPTGITGAPSTRWTVAILLAFAFNLASILWSLRAA